MNLRAAIPALLALNFATAEAVRAEKPAPFPKFEAKRVTAPGARSNGFSANNRRITVQIDPEEQARILAARAPFNPEDAAKAVEDAPAKPSREPAYAWFWESVSPALDGAHPDRLAPALRALDGPQKVAAPRLQTLQNIARQQGAPILASTAGTNVSPALVLAMISIESSGRMDAVSSAGAAGLMQLMPDTATRFGVTDRLSAEQNIKGGVKYLDWLMQEFNNDPILVLAGYNAGEGAVKKHKGVPPYAETRDYVPKVLAAFQIASGLCRTPPELISDGCVFVAMN